MSKVWSLTSQKHTTQSRLKQWKGTFEGSGFENQRGNLGKSMLLTQFLDCPAVAIINLAVEQAAENHKEVATDLKLPQEAVLGDSSKLLWDTYVDDGTTGDSPEDVSHMMGHKLPTSEFSGTIPAMACKVCLKIKCMVCSGSDNQEAIDKLFGAVLGYKWALKEDLLSVSLKFNISKKRKGKCLDPDLFLSDIDKLKSTKLNRRMLLRICNGI